LRRRSETLERCYRYTVGSEHRRRRQPGSGSAEDAVQRASQAAGLVQKEASAAVRRKLFLRRSGRGRGERVQDPRGREEKSSLEELSRRRADGTQPQDAELCGTLSEPVFNHSTVVSRKEKVKVRTLDIAPLRESSPHKRSGIPRVLKGFHSFTCTPTRSSAIGMSHTCLCLPSHSWYSFTDPGGMRG